MKTLYLVIGAIMWLISVLELCLIIVAWFQERLEGMAFIGPLFTHTDWNDRLPPTLVLIVFALLLLAIFIHSVRVWREQTAISLLRDKNSINEQLHQRSTLSPKTKAHRRVTLFIDLMRAPSSAVHDVIPEQSEFDSAAIDGDYRFANVLIWTLPVIGFIGTAWGMSHAIGGFSGALGDTMRSGTLDSGTLMARLSQVVIPGLAQAFGVTMLALTTAIVGHFCLTVVHAREVSLLQQLDRISVRWLAAIPKQQSGFLPPALLKAMQDIGEESSRLTAAADRLTAAAEHVSAAANSLSTASSHVTNAARELQASVLIPYHVTIERGQRHA